MTKAEIFDRVVQTMLEDSATKKDQLGADPDPYRQQVSEDMSDEDFVFLVLSYLGTFGVLSHVTFGKTTESKSLGFGLRYHEGLLYVLYADPETGLKKGDQIIALGGQSIAELSQRHADFLTSKTLERSWMQWRILVDRYKDLELIRDNQPLNVTVQPPSAGFSHPQVLSWKQLNPQTVYLRLENFWNEAELSRLYQEVESAIQQSPYLIIDVRVNNGGTDSLYLPLLKYGLAEGQTLADLPDDEDYGMEILYTEANVDLRLQAFEEYLASPDMSEDSRRFVEELAQELRANRGKGYLTYQSEDDGVFNQVKGLSYPKKVVVLTDVTCGSSGDNFAMTMKQLPKVTLIGRPTMGILDYSNVCQLQLDDYLLVFPTSRWLAIDEGKGMTDQGVQPDLLLEWTPDYLQTDLDLAAALAFLDNSDDI